MLSSISRPHSSSMARRNSALREVKVIPLETMEDNNNHISLAANSILEFDAHEEDHIIEVHNPALLNLDGTLVTPRRLGSVEIELNVKPPATAEPPLQTSSGVVLIMALYRALSNLISQNFIALIVLTCAALTQIPILTGHDFSLTNSSLEQALTRQSLRSVVLSCLTLTIPVWLELALDVFTYYTTPLFRLDWYELVSRVLLQLALLLPMIVVFTGPSHSIGILFVSFLYLQIIVWAGVILSLLHYYSPQSWTVRTVSILLILLTASYLLDFSDLAYPETMYMPAAAVTVRFICFTYFAGCSITQNISVNSWTLLCRLTHREYSSLIIGIAGSTALFCYALQTVVLPAMSIKNCDDLNLNWYFILLSAFILVTTVMPGRSARFEAVQLKHNLEVKRTFVKYVSHEVRTPLNTICMGLELIETDLRRAGAKPDTIETVGQLKESALLAVETLSDLLLYEKIDSGVMALELLYYEPQSFLNQACSPFRVQARAKDITLRVIEMPQSIESLSILIDDKKMSQVIRNYVSNALKFTPKGGTVDIGMEILTGKILRIYVKDSGFGISIGNQRKVFNEIVQFHANQQQGGGGSGLGLWITKKIVELHEGKVGLRSEGEGRGTTFYVDLPLYEVQPDNDVPPLVSYAHRELHEDGALQELPISLHRKRSSQTLRKRLSICEGLTDGSHMFDIEEGKRGHYSILIVDDTELNRKVMVKALASKGHECNAIDDGDEAVKLFTPPSALAVDVILMDKYMPRMDGPIATKRIRELGFTGFIIGVTGDTDPIANAEFLSSGADMVLVKPMKVVVFEKVMEELIAARELKNAIVNANNSRKERKHSFDQISRL